MHLFLDRKEAGKILASELKAYAENKDVLLLALPRGGVEIAAPIADKLNLPLEVILTRKIPYPGHSEYAMGAISELGNVSLNEEIVKNFDKQLVWQIVEKQQEEIERRQKVYRKDKKLPSLRGKIVILIDDGIATGFTLKSAILSLKDQKLKKLIVAVPVSAKDAAQEINKLVDQFVCLYIPENFYAVGQFYANFPQNTDEEVINYLTKYRN